MKNRPGYLNHLLWGIIGIAGAIGMWYAWSIPGMLLMFAAIGAPFLMTHFLGGKGAWVALITVGVMMSSVLTWQAATGARCPDPGQKVYFKANKPPVDCAELSRGASSMAVFFAIVALVGVSVPFYARRMDDDDNGDNENTSTSAAGSV